ncbi:MAG: hypothetical protein ACYS8W_00825 [Planctomycetota bacterium]|jgi:hypothetical protein
MKISLPLKLGIGVILLFSLVIAAWFLRTPIRFFYWKSRLDSDSEADRKKAVARLIKIAPFGQERLAGSFINGSKSFRASAAIVLSNSGWDDFGIFGNAEFREFVKVLASLPDEFRISPEYREKVKKRLFTLRPSRRDDDYYDLFYRISYSGLDDETLQRSAVFSGLIFLAANQATDGRWMSEDGTQEGDMLCTGLSLLAFVGYGQTHERGKYQDAVFYGFRFLLKQIDEEDRFSENTFVHTVCTMALCEFFAVTRDAEVKDDSDKVIRHLLTRQLPGGGFPERLGGKTPEARATFYSVLALKAGKMGKLEIPYKVFENIIVCIDNSGIVQREHYKKEYLELNDFHGFGTEIKKPDGTETPEKIQERLRSVAMTMLSTIFMGRKRTHYHIKIAEKTIMEHLSSPENCDVEYVYWANYSMFQLGGKNWSKWNDAVKKLLLVTDKTTEYLYGSWEPKQGLLSEKHGRVITTALNALTLETYWAYARVARDPVRQYKKSLKN